VELYTVQQQLAQLQTKLNNTQESQAEVTTKRVATEEALQQVRAGELSAGTSPD
jgi:hypothetical protein